MLPGLNFGSDITRSKPYPSAIEPSVRLDFVPPLVNFISLSTPDTAACDSSTSVRPSATSKTTLVGTIAYSVRRPSISSRRNDARQRGAHHDLDERIRDKVQPRELRDVPRKLNDLCERVERSRLDHHKDRTPVVKAGSVARRSDVPGDVPDAASDEGGDEDVVSEGDSILGSSEAREVRDEDGVPCSDLRKE